MFEGSNRVSLVKPSAIRRMLERSSGMKNVVHLEQGEPDFTTPSHIWEAAAELLYRARVREDVVF